MTENQIDVIMAAMDHKLSVAEKSAILDVVMHGERYGYGNLIAWLKTAWAMQLLQSTRNLSIPWTESDAIQATTGGGVYPFWALK